MADFTLEYDDQLEAVVEKISKALEKKHGLTIEMSEEDTDGYVDYNIVKRKDLR